MQYKEGDRVVIKPWGLMVEQYTLDCDDDIIVDREGCSECFFQETESDLEGTNRVVTIKSVFSDYYECTRIEQSIINEMILCYAFEYGEKFEASDVRGPAKWREATYSHYAIGHRYPYRTPKSGYKYVRPLPKMEQINLRYQDGDGNDITDIVSAETERGYLNRRLEKLK